MNSKQYSLSTYAHREVGASVQLSTYVENDVGFGEAILRNMPRRMSNEEDASQVLQF